MSNTSAKIVRSIVAGYFQTDTESVRISGCIYGLPTYKEWWAYTSKGFIRVEPFVNTGNPYFFVSVHKGVYTVHVN